MSRFGVAVARQRGRAFAWVVLPALAAFLVCGLLLFGVFVPDKTKTVREAGRIVDFQEAGKGESVGYYVHVELEDGRRVVVASPSRQLCLMGQRVSVVRYSTWFGTRYSFPIEGCRITP